MPENRFVAAGDLQFEWKCLAAATSWSSPSQQDNISLLTDMSSHRQQSEEQ